MPLLEIRELSKTFAIEGGVFRQAVGQVQAVRLISLTIERGETLAIVGGSGCGKSTLARLIAGLLTPDSGTLSWEGRSIAGLPRTERARLIQMIFQDPYASLNPKLSIATQLCDALRMNRNPPASADAMTQGAVRLLESVGLSAEELGHYPFQFSGGQRQRIAIARVLALEPSLLIADEPLSALDVTIQAQILRLFQTLKKERGLTMLFITHDLSVLPGFADRVIVMQDGLFVESGATETVLRSPQHPYTRALLDAVPRLSVC